MNPARTNEAANGTAPRMIGGLGYANDPVGEGGVGTVTARVVCFKCRSAENVTLDSALSEGEQWDAAEKSMPRWSFPDVGTGRIALCPTCSDWYERSKTVKLAEFRNEDDVDYGCDKCASRNLFVKYATGNEEYAMTTGEHLACRCGRCGYQFAMEVMINDATATGDARGKTGGTEEAKRTPDSA